MKKSGIVSIIALLVALTGLLIALAAYFKKRKCLVCDDFTDEMMDDDSDEYFSAQFGQDEAEAHSGASSAPSEEPTQAEEDSEPTID